MPVGLTPVTSLSTEVASIVSPVVEPPSSGQKGTCHWSQEPWVLPWELRSGKAG